MLAVKSLRIPYRPSEEVIDLLKAFRDMVNYCIHIGLERGITSRFTLSNKVYHELIKYGLHTWYVLEAIEVATSILKNYRKAKRRNGKVRTPYAKRIVAKLGNQAYSVVGDKLRIPIKPRQYFYVKLHKRALKFLLDATLKLGSITLTASTVSVVFSITAEVIEPEGYVAYDTNEKSVDGAFIDSDEVKITKFDLSRIGEIRNGYFERVSKLQAKYAKDRRVTKKIQNKWFAKQNDRINSILHKVSKEIVKKAKSNKQGIILENLKHIRKAINRKC